MFVLALWFVIGAFFAAFGAFVASHFRRPTLRVQAACWLTLYVAVFVGLAAQPDATRPLGSVGWIFSRHVPLAVAWKPLLGTYVAFGLMIAYFIPRYEVLGLGPQQGTLRRVVFPFRAVALTFDDGPDPEWTPKVLEVLKKHQVKATFFMVGESVEKHPELVRAVAQAGHTVGSHSWSHRCMPLLDAAALADEIDRARSALEKVLGQPAPYFRPPWGMFNRRVLDELRARGYLTVLWSRSSQDWRNHGVDRIHALVTARPEMGDIVLFHDGGNYPKGRGGEVAAGGRDGQSRAQTVEALDRIIPDLEGQGFQLKTIDEMVRAWLS